MGHHFPKRKSFVPPAYRWLQLLSLFVVFAACSKNDNKVSAGQGLGSQLQLGIHYTKGTDQLVSLRQPLPAALTAHVTNNAGAALGEVALSLCLLDVTGIPSKDLDHEAVLAACVDGKTSISSVPYSTDASAVTAPKTKDLPDDLVGRATGWTGKTDKNGVRRRARHHRRGRAVRRGLLRHLAA